MGVKEELHKLIGKANVTVSEINVWVNKNITYVEDRVLYDKADYWATPEETMEKEAGDCEDIAILKYWVLKNMGKTSRLAYVIQVDNRQPHVVRMWNNLILDNRCDDVLGFLSRTDIVPVFFFDEHGLYVHGSKVAETSRLPVWKELLNKLAQEADHD